MHSGSIRYFVSLHWAIHLTNRKQDRGEKKYFRANTICILGLKSVYKNSFMTIFAVLVAKAWASDGHPWFFREWSYSLSHPTVMWMLEWWWAGPGSRPRHKLDWHYSSRGDWRDDNLTLLMRARAAFQLRSSDTHTPRGASGTMTAANTLITAGGGLAFSSVRKKQTIKTTSTIIIIHVRVYLRKLHLRS